MNLSYSGEEVRQPALGDNSRENNPSQSVILSFIVA